MEIVVDTSAVIAVLASEPERRALVRITRGADLIAPESVHWEVGNALVNLCRKRRATQAEIQRMRGIYELIPLRFVDVVLSEAIDLAAAHGLYAYDAYVLSCAQKRRCSLLTLDTGLIRVAQALAVSLVEVKG